MWCIIPPLCAVFWIVMISRPYAALLFALFIASIISVDCGTEVFFKPVLSIISKRWKCLNLKFRIRNIIIIGITIKTLFDDNSPIIETISTAVFWKVYGFFLTSDRSFALWFYCFGMLIYRRVGTLLSCFYRLWPIIWTYW